MHLSVQCLEPPHKRCICRCLAEVMAEEMLEFEKPGKFHASACSSSPYNLKPLSILPKKPLPFDFAYLLISV